MQKILLTIIQSVAMDGPTTVDDTLVNFYWDAQFPGFDPEGSPTPRRNCHAYAMGYQSSDVWINDPGPLWTDDYTITDSNPDIYTKGTGDDRHTVKLVDFHPNGNIKTTREKNGASKIYKMDYPFPGVNPSTIITRKKNP